MSSRKKGTRKVNQTNWTEKGLNKQTTHDLGSFCLLFFSSFFRVSTPNKVEQKNRQNEEREREGRKEKNFIQPPKSFPRNYSRNVVVVEHPSVQQQQRPRQ